MPSSQLKNRLPRLLAVFALLCLVLMPGCVRRRLLVRSNPPGATVYVDNQQIGTTPCATNFVYYGTREIRLVKPGYETLTINQPIPAPWYELPPLDFISENLIPREIQDYRTLSYNLQPQVLVPTDQLLGRAEQLRASSQQNAVVPAGAMVPASNLPGPISFETQPHSGSPMLLPPQGSPALIPPAVGTPVPVGPTTLVPQPLPPYEPASLRSGEQSFEPLPARQQPVEVLPQAR
ncbi:PEGA domain-containing protein [Adhaeretor mobilis]|uniref:PEGA domain protein n=1 Tax=Adhaeretor mobilis TaxID=1930276 RepID=A0A517N0J8_9BACT|nr:PEGA domain-containing protein [Adhaeretor mobilis]QDT00662.1 PEGA domain protein [Adhaeretor mobilis]